MTKKDRVALDKLADFLEALFQGPRQTMTIGRGEMRAIVAARAAIRKAEASK